MKASEVYLKAAMRMAAKKDCFSCTSIERASNGQGEPFIKKYAAIFKPCGVETEGIWFGDCACRTDENLGVRVLALCFMSAIAADEDRSTR
jgi:hypothetical protein